MHNDALVYFFIGLLIGALVAALLLFDGIPLILQFWQLTKVYA